MSFLVVIAWAHDVRAELTCAYSEVEALTKTDPETGDTSVSAGAETFARSGAMAPIRWKYEDLEFVWRERDSLGDRITIYVRIDEPKNVFRLYYFDRDGTGGTLDALRDVNIDSKWLSTFESGATFGRRFRCFGSYR